MSCWIDWFPDRLKEELDAYANHSMAVTIDEDSRDRGTFCLVGELKLAGKIYRIRVVYPSLFPYFAPLAFLLDERLSRHFHPVNSNLCLLGRGTKQWRSNDKFADVIAERFPIILAINESTDENFIKSEERASRRAVQRVFQWKCNAG